MQKEYQSSLKKLAKLLEVSGLSIRNNATGSYQIDLGFAAVQENKINH